MEKTGNENHRTRDEIKEHYEIEKELANRLRLASKSERRHLYSSLYNELYQRVPYHPQLTKKTSPQEQELATASQMEFIKPFLSKCITFLEIGPGDCALSLEVAKLVKQVYAVDVSDEITQQESFPPNFYLILSDGISIPLPSDSVDVVYSNQLMEHLHPEDAFEQVKNIYNVMIPGGIYICITPNRLDGPHDISKYFDEVATGFHLKEYTTFEIVSLFRKVGFSCVKVCIGGKGMYFNFPAFLIALYEKMLNNFPYSFRKMILGIPLFRVLLGTRFVAIK